MNITYPINNAELYSCGRLTIVEGRVIPTLLNENILVVVSVGSQFLPITNNMFIPVVVKSP